MPGFVILILKAAELARSGFKADLVNGEIREGMKEF